MADERGEYRGIYVALVDDPDFQDLTPEGRWTFSVLKLTLGKTGIGVCYQEALVHRTGYAPAVVTEAMDELDRSGWIARDRNVVWIRNGLRFEPSLSLDNKNHRTGVVRHLQTLPKLPIVAEFARYYQLDSPFPPEGPQRDTPSHDSESHANAIPDYRNGNGERKTDTETETEQPADAASPETSPPPREKASTTAGDGGLSGVVHEALNELAILARPEERQPLLIEAMKITRGLDTECWKDGKGRTAPADDRPRLLKLAVYHWAEHRAEGSEMRLRSCLRYVVAQQLDGHALPQANRPSPGSTAGKFSPGTTDDAVRADIQREQDADVQADQLRIQRWRNEHPDEAAEIDAAVEAEQGEPPEDPNSTEAVTRRVTVRAEVNRRITAEIEKRGAA